MVAYQDAELSGTLTIRAGGRNKDKRTLKDYIIYTKEIGTGFLRDWQMSTHDGNLTRQALSTQEYNRGKYVSECNRECKSECKSRCQK